MRNFHVGGFYTFRYQLPAASYQLLASSSGSRTPDPGPRIPDPGSRIPDPGSRTPDPGSPGWKRAPVCDIVDFVPTHGRRLVFGALLAAAIALAGTAAEGQSKPPATEAHAEHAAPPASFT